MAASFLSRAMAGLPAIAFLFVAAFVGAADLPPAEAVRVPTPAYGRYLEVIKESRALIDSGNFDRLDALADELRTSKERLDGGTWLLSSYYGVVGDLPDSEQGQTDRIALLEKWVAERPASITARVALARALTRFAWKARGNGASDTVSDEGWKLFGERLDLAKAVLTEARRLPQSCPGWYEVDQTVALGQGWDEEEYFAMVNEAIGKEPTYGRYYTDACYWMLPRWYGEKGQFEAWIASLADKAPESERDRQYVFLVWMADRMSAKGEIVFGRDRLDWARTKQGFRDWIAAEPDNLMVRFELTRLALLADDGETAREQFDHTGGRYFPTMWNLETFEAARRFAYEGAPNPLIPKQVAEPQGPKYSYETIRNIRIGVHVLLALAGGFLAGLVLLIIAWQRGAVWAGVISVFAAVFTALPFGTIGSLAAGVGLLIYLRKRPASDLPTEVRVSPWITLLGVVVLSGGYLMLQMLAVIPAIMPSLLEMGLKHQQDAVNLLMSNGQAAHIAISAAWLSILGTIAFCGAKKPIRDRLGLQRPNLRATLIWLPVFLIALLGIGYALDPFMDKRTLEAIKLIQLWRHSPATFILSMCVFAPVAEELIFRGYAYTGWIRSMGWWLTALVTSVIFALLHFQYGWVALVDVFVLGMLLALLRRLSGSVIPCLVLHSLFNAIFVVSTFVAPLK